MDISRLQLRSAPPVSRASTLPFGLRTPVEIGPIPAVPDTGTLPPLVPDDASDIAGQVFDDFAAAWKQRLSRFVADDPIFRA